MGWFYCMHLALLYGLLTVYAQRLGETGWQWIWLGSAVLTTAIAISLALRG